MVGTFGNTIFKDILEEKEIYVSSSKIISSDNSSLIDSISLFLLPYRLMYKNRRIERSLLYALKLAKTKNLSQEQITDLLPILNLMVDSIADFQDHLSASKTLSSKNKRKLKKSTDNIILANAKLKSYLQMSLYDLRTERKIKNPNDNHLLEMVMHNNIIELSKLQSTK